MKKIIFSLLFLTLLLPSTASSTTTMENCSMETIPSGQTSSGTCLLNGGKIATDDVYCNVNMPPGNQVCCCNTAITYSCRWQASLTGIAMGYPNDWSHHKPECKSNESTGTDCNPINKPENQMVNGKSTSPICCCPGATTTFTEKAKFTMPSPEIIDIDALKLSTATCTDADNSGTCSIPWVAQLIQYLYTFGLGIGGILAAVVLMAGGLVWLVSAGDATKITQAKSLIVGSITGLMILFGSYILLTQINPNLVVLKPLSLKMIETIVITADSEASTPVSLDMNGIAETLGVNCGSDTVADIINKSKGKVTYNNPNRGTVGPNNTVYNDCSGFASFVLKCGLNKTTASYTGDIFSEQISWAGDIASLQEGDLIGWAPKNSDKGFGHVFIYMGDGVFGDCHGGTNGRKPGNCVSTNLNLNSVKASASSYTDGKLFIKRY